MRVLKLFALWHSDDHLQEHPTLLLICEALDFPFMTWVDVIAIIRISFLWAGAKSFSLPL